MSANEDERMIYRKKEETISRRIAGETLLVPIRGKLADLQRLFALEGAAEFIWEKIDGEHTVKDICDAIVARYDVAREDACKDLEEFLLKLKQADLVAEVD